MNNTGYRNTGDWNTGDRNTGYRNTGDRNTGNRNTGKWNTGDWNTGNRNTGKWNTGDWNTVNKETGFFNTKPIEKIRVFNKDCNVEEWENAEKPEFLYFYLTKWVMEDDMTDKEKENNSSYTTTGGYLKVFEYKEAFKKSYNDLSTEEKEKQIEILKKLPNFDADVFFEISGIDIKKTDKIKVEANGKTVYISKESAKELGLV